MSTACYTVLGQDLIKKSRQEEERSKSLGYLRLFSDPSEKNQAISNLRNQQDKPSDEAVKAYEYRWKSWHERHPDAFYPDLVDDY